MSLTKVSYSMIQGEVVNVLDYGADNTGATDSTSAIAAALATGKSVYFPTGTYQSDTQNITTAGQTIFGDGVNSIIVAKTASNDLFAVKADYVVIKSLRLNGVETASTNTTFAITTDSTTKAKYLLVENVLFSGATSSVGFSNAIKFDDDCSYGSVFNCIIERLWGITSGHGYGVLAGNVIGCNVSNNRMIATSGRGRHGIYFSAGCSDSMADNNYIDGFDGEGISQYSTGAQNTCSRNAYSNNTLRTCASGSNPFSGSIGIYGHSFGCVISNNTITASGNKGIAIDGSSITDCSNTIITGNVVVYSGTTGIDLTSAIRTLIIGNIVYESSTDNAGTSANIMLRTDGATGCQETLIEGNVCGGTTYARSCVTVDAGPPGPSALQLQFNDFQPCRTYTLELNGVPDIQIDGRLQFEFSNVGYGPIANGASYTGPLALPGVVQGQICTVTHDQNTDGCVLYVYANGAGTGVLTIANLSGGSKTIPSGTLRVDAWERSAPLN